MKKQLNDSQKEQMKFLFTLNFGRNTTQQMKVSTLPDQKAKLSSSKVLTTREVFYVICMA
jgi:hypothetical protein